MSAAQSLQMIGSPYRSYSSSFFWISSFASSFEMVGTWVLKMCGTIGFRRAGGRVVGTLGFVGAQASHKGTGVIEIGSKANLTRFSFMM